MKKILAIVLAAAMVLGLAACGSSTTTTTAASGGEQAATTAASGEAAPAGDIALDGTWPAETVKIGVEVYDTTDEQLLALQTYFDYLEEHFNVEFMYSESIADAEGELDFVNRCADAGCQAFFGYYNIGLADTIKACTARKMYYVGTGDAYDDVKDDPYYLGCYKLTAEVNGEEVNGDYYGGYLLGKTLGENNHDHIMYCNGGAAFVQFFKDRQDGFLQGLKDGGYTTFNEETDILQGFPEGDEWFISQAQMLAQDYDAVGSSFNIALFFQAEGERIAAGEEPFAMAAIGEVSDTYYDFMNAGCIEALVYDCEELVFGCHFAMIMNAVLGNPEMSQNSDGTPLRLPVERWLITEADQFNAIYDYHDAGNFFASAEQVANVIKAYNPNATVDDEIALYRQTLDQAIASIK